MPSRDIPMAHKKYCSEKIVERFNTNSLKGFGVDSMIEGVICAGTILHYLDQNKQNALNHIVSINNLFSWPKHSKIPFGTIYLDYFIFLTKIYKYLTCIVL